MKKQEEEKEETTFTRRKLLTRASALSGILHMDVSLFRQEAGKTNFKYDK